MSAAAAAAAQLSNSSVGGLYENAKVILRPPLL